MITSTKHSSPANPLRIVKRCKELVTLRDYRMCHAYHKTELDLINSRSIFPLAHHLLSCWIPGPTIAILGRRQRCGITSTGA